MIKIINIAIFASGSGTNAENIIKYFSKSNTVKIKCVLCNNPSAYVIQRAQKFNIHTYIFNKYEFYNSQKVLNILNEEQIDLIVLSGFLWLVPKNIIHAYNKRIINIHPALLPKYGGKGMYGDNVHKAVYLNKEKKTGITIHFVNENYDQGDIISQYEVNIAENDTPESIANMVHKLEYKYFPEEIEKISLSLQKK